MNRILLAATAALALAVSANFAAAADAKFMFRWKGVVLTQNGTGAGGSGSEGTGDHGGDGSGGDVETGDGGGSGDGSGGTGDDGDGDDGTGARMSLSVRPSDDGALREHYRLNMPFAIPTFLAAPSGTYGDDDTLTVCWDTEVYDLDGIAAHGLAIGWRLELPPSPLVRAIMIAGGARVERDMDSFDSVFIDGSGTSGCADLELNVPEADSFGWGMGIPLGVKAVADVYAAWWAHDPVAWTEPGAYDTTEHEGPGWLYLDAQRIE